MYHVGIRLNAKGILSGMYVSCKTWAIYLGMCVSYQTWAIYLGMCVSGQVRVHLYMWLCVSMYHVKHELYILACVYQVKHELYTLACVYQVKYEYIWTCDYVYQCIMSNMSYVIMLYYIIMCIRPNTRGTCYVSKTRKMNTFVSSARI